MEETFTSLTWAQPSEYVKNSSSSRTKPLIKKWAKDLTAVSPKKTDNSQHTHESPQQSPGKANQDQRGATSHLLAWLQRLEPRAACGRWRSGPQRAAERMHPTQAGPRQAHTPRS